MLNKDKILTLSNRYHIDYYQLINREINSFICYKFNKRKAIPIIFKDKIFDDINV